jgi:hypothetical protein
MDQDRRELCRAAATEQGSSKLRGLVAEIVKELDKRDRKPGTGGDQTCENGL